MSAPGAANEVRTRDPELDGLRGVAIALVLAGHLLAFKLGQAWSLPLGALGVQLFFALSGFLITRLLLEELEATGGIDLGRFYVRRAFRIFPAFYVFLAVIALLMVAGHVRDTNWRSFAASALYISNLRGSSVTLAHTWSLSLEEQFYALWPIGLILMSKGRRRGLTLALILSFMVWRAVAIALQLWPYESAVFYERTDFRLDSLLLGALIALGPTARFVTRIRFPITLMLVSGVIFVLSPGLDGIPALRPVALSVTEVSSAGVLLGVVNSAGSSATSWLRTSALRGLGRVSYSLYLWQQPLLVAPLVGVPLVGGAFSSLVTCLMLGVGSFVLVERPMLKLRDSGTSSRRILGASSR